MEGSGRLYRAGKFWVIDADPYTMGFFVRLFPKAQLYKHKGQLTSRPRCIRQSRMASRELAWFLQRFNLDVSINDRLVLDSDVFDHDLRISSIKEVQEGKFNLLQMKIPLRHYQQEAVAIIDRLNRLLVGDAVGLGKTLIGIATTALDNALPALLVMPTHLVDQWAQEIGKFHSTAVVAVLGGKRERADGMPTATHFLVPYSRLHAWTEELFKANIKSVIFDEVHELRHDTTAKYSAAFHLSERAHRVVGLSATPIFNYGEEIYSVLDVINPGALGVKSEFQREWCSGKIVHDPLTLRKFLLDNGLLIRRTRADVGRELDPINKFVLTVDADLNELAKIQNVATKLAQQALLGDFEESGRAAREFDVKLRHATGMAKAKAVASVVSQILKDEEDEKVVLFGWHHDVYSIWLRELREFHPVFYTGRESPKEKQESLNSFIDGKSRVFIMSLRAGAGLNGLQTVSSTCVFGELDWSPSLHLQCIGRLARDGQKKPVNAVYVVVDDGADPPMLEILGVKKEQSDGIIDGIGGQDVSAPVSRLKAAAEDYLRKKGIGLFEKKVTHNEIVDGLIDQIRRMKLPVTNEKDLQDVLGPVLSKYAGMRRLPFSAEHILSDKDRIDFRIGNIGIECKVKGSRPEVYRQVSRYLAHDLECVILVCPWPLQNFTIDKKPVYIVNINENALF